MENNKEILVDIPSTEGYHRVTAFVDGDMFIHTISGINKCSWRIGPTGYIERSVESGVGTYYSRMMPRNNDCILRALAERVLLGKYEE